MNKYISKYLFYYPVTLLRGEFINRHLKFYEKFQWQDRDDIERYQLEKLKWIVNYAYSHSAYYKSFYDTAHVSPDDIQSLQDIRHLPVLTKSELSNNVHEIKTDNTAFSSKKTTGGSTGQVVTLYKNPDALARERAAGWRAYKWAGVDVCDPQGRFWGIPLHQKNKLMYKIVDIVGNRIRLSAFNITNASLKEYAEKLFKFKPTYLYGYVSVILKLAEYFDENNLSLPKSVKSIITTSEVLNETTRDYLQRVFNIKVFNEYGCGEVGFIAVECAQGNLHIMEDNLIVELLDENNEPSDTGEIVVTDLFNTSTPLIRYKLADYAKYSQNTCSCGRGLKTLSNIFGRAYDILRSPDGTQYHPEIIMYIFEDIKVVFDSIKQFQVVQSNSNILDIYLVIPGHADKKIEAHIKNEIFKRISPEFEICFHYVQNIEREKSGKIRLIKSLIS